METQLNNSSGSVVDLFGKDVRIEIPKDKKQLLYSYIDMGWPVVANYGIYRKMCNCFEKGKCDDPGKHPRTEKGSRTVLSTKDKNKIDEWLDHKFIQYSNWATKCGKESEIIAFDIDPRHGGKRDAFDFPPTLEYRTQGGGWRLIYEYPDFEIDGNSKFAEGIELIVNGFITLPPSQGLMGAYKWINNLPIAKISKEFIALGNKQLNGDTGYSLPDEILEGDRDINAYKYACSLRAQGYEKFEIFNALTVANENRFKPPLDEKQIIEKVESACKHPKGKDKFGIYDDPIETESRFRLKTAKDVYQPREERKFIIEQIIQSGTLSIWVGAFGSKKSLSAIIASVCVALGKDWIGQKTIQSPILFIDEESGDWLLEERFEHAINGENGNENIPIYYLSLSGFNFFKNQDDPENLKDFIIQTGAKLVFIDTLAAIMAGGNENEVATVQPIFMEFRRICNETGAAIVILHHTNKKDMYRGSSAIPGALDMMVKIESKEDTNQIKFKSEKVRAGKPFTFYSEIHFEDGMVYMSESGPFAENKEKTNYQKVILDYFEYHNNELFLTDFLDTVPSEKIESYRSTIYRMAKKGTIEKIEEESEYGSTKYKRVENVSNVAIV